MKKKSNRNPVGLLIGIGSIFLTLIVTTSMVSTHLRKAVPEAETMDEEWQQSFESIVSGMNLDESRLETVNNTTTEAVEDETEAASLLERIKYSPDGRAYTPYVSVSDWESASEAERWAYTRNTIPVLQDWNMTIDSICMDSLIRSSRSYILSRQLYNWCQEEGIEACEGEYLAYCSYIGQGKESFYVELDDEDHTVIVCQSVSHGLYWKFSYCEESEEFLNQLREQEQKDRKGVKSNGS